MDYSKLPFSIHLAQNQVRTNPQSFIPKLEAILKYYDGDLYRRPGKIPIRTNEGPNAVRECIEQLRNLKPLPELTLNEDMSRACTDHVNDIGPKGSMSHDSSDGTKFGRRLERYGEWSGTIGESCDFGSETGEEVICSLLIDDGVPNRGHRKNILNPEFRFVGISSGKHASYDHCHVLDYASAYNKKGQSGGSQPSGGYGGSYQPQSYTQPSSYSQPSSYGQPTSYGGQPSYTQPTSYGQPSSYGQPGSYSQPGSYGSQPGSYGSQPGSYGQPGGYGQPQTTTNTTVYGNKNLINDPNVQAQVNKAKTSTYLTSEGLRELAQKEAPPGTCGWSISSEVETFGNTRKTKVDINYKFADGSSKDVRKEFLEQI